MIAYRSFELYSNLGKQASEVRIWSIFWDKKIYIRSYNSMRWAI